DDDVAVAEQGGEDREEHQREDEREERRCRVAPEGLVDVAELGQRHRGGVHRPPSMGTAASTWPPVSWRYTSSSEGRRTCRSSRSNPCSMAHPVSRCNAAVRLTGAISTHPSAVGCAVTSAV